MDLNEATQFARKKFKEKSIASASLDAEVLLLEAIAIAHRKVTRDKEWLYLNLKTYELSEREEDIFRDFVRRRITQEPVAYIMGRKEFFGLDLYVDSSTLIPRSDSELIVEKALEAIEAADDGLILMDIGTGSGCIPIAILKSLEQADKGYRVEKFFADDISRAALRIARKNARLHGLSDRIDFLDMDLEKALERLPKGKRIIITANLPYIAPAKYSVLSKNVRAFEPKTALVSAEKGLHHIKRLIEKFAVLQDAFRAYSIFLEADPVQMRSIEKIAKKNLNECDIRTFRDLRGKKRVIGITRS